MAQKVTVTLVDDMDGGEATETVEFGIDGATYEIDLSGTNAENLRSAIDKFAQSGRKMSTTGRGAKRQTTARRPRANVADIREQNDAIRAWARKKGLTVHDRGRIPADIVAQFNAEH